MVKTLVDMGIYCGTLIKKLLNLLIYLTTIMDIIHSQLIVKTTLIMIWRKLLICEKSFFHIFLFYNYLYIKKIMKKPSEITEIEIKFSKIIPPSDFLAITFFGVVYINEKNRDYWENLSDEKREQTKNHEMIHVKQARMENDCWFIFYIKYLWYWIKAMFCCWFRNYIAYYAIPYEMDAYANEDNMDYNLEKYETYASYSTKERVDMRTSHLWTWKEFLQTL